MRRELNVKVLVFLFFVFVAISVFVSVCYNFYVTCLVLVILMNYTVFFIG